MVSRSAARAEGADLTPAVGIWRPARNAAAAEPPPRAVRLVREALLVLAALAVLALAAFLLTYTRTDPGFSHAAAAASIGNAGGRVGAWIADLLYLVFGVSAWWWVAAAAAWVVRSFRRAHA